MTVERGPIPTTVMMASWSTAPDVPGRGRWAREPRSNDWFRPSDGWGSMGLWAARQLVDDLFVDKSPSGGCRVFLTARIASTSQRASEVTVARRVPRHCGA